MRRGSVSGPQVVCAVRLRTKAARLRLRRRCRIFLQGFGRDRQQLFKAERFGQNSDDTLGQRLFFNVKRAADKHYGEVRQTGVQFFSDFQTVHDGHGDIA